MYRLWDWTTSVENPFQFDRVRSNHHRSRMQTGRHWSRQHPSKYFHGICIFVWKYLDKSARLSKLRSSVIKWEKVDFIFLIALFYGYTGQALIFSGKTFTWLLRDANMWGECWFQAIAHTCSPSVSFTSTKLSVTIRFHSTILPSKNDVISSVPST